MIRVSNQFEVEWESRVRKWKEKVGWESRAGKWSENLKRERWWKT